jgi:hypothetical protein
MAGAPVQTRSINLIKDKLLRPALTSHFICDFPLPARNTGDPNYGGLKEWVKSLRFDLNFDSELTDRIQLLCSEASLPGASLLTHEINNDYTGITQRHAYRRSFDDRADFTFYVDQNYDIIKFFQLWISFIANEKEFESTEQGPDYRLGSESRTYNYRVRFPDDYMIDTLTIRKFERDFSGKYLEYQFFDAFPTSINSMPVSYDSSQLLKCTVSFTYSRYVMRDVIEPAIDFSKKQVVGVTEISSGVYQVQYLENGRVITTITNQKPPAQ